MSAAFSPPAATATPNRVAARRDRLVDAAEIVFAREGLRGASMERIAVEAAVARATAYAYFTDKEAAFVAVAERLAARLERAVADALNTLDRPKSDLPDSDLQGRESPAHRLCLAVCAKHAIAWRVARSSPHAADLIAAKDRLAGPIFAASQDRIVAMYADVLAAAAVPGPQQVAHILYTAAAGIAAGATSSADLQADLTRGISAIVRGAKMAPG